jgi:hypothetical protein
MSSNHLKYDQINLPEMKLKNSKTVKDVKQTGDDIEYDEHEYSDDGQYRHGNH